MIDHLLAQRRYLAGYWALLTYAGSHLRQLANPALKAVFERQLYFTGIQGLALVAAIGLLSGAVLATQVTALLGAGELSVRGLVLVLVDELGPLLAAIIVIARSSVAIAAELALMHARDETAHLRLMRIPPLDYLVVPRIAAVTVSLFALTVYFQIVAVAGGLASSALFQNVRFASQIDRLLDVITPAEVLVAAAKSICFGLCVSCISCFQGLDVGKTVTAVPVAAMRAVVQSLIAVFVIDGLFAYIRFAAT